MDNPVCNSNGQTKPVGSQDFKGSGAPSVEFFRDFDFGSAMPSVQDEAPRGLSVSKSLSGREPMHSSFWSEPKDTTALSPPDPPAARGRSRYPEVAGYEILGELGRGGMGVVYKARELRLNRRVALKMILAGDHAGPDALARLLTEAETIARLKHPNIVQVYAIGDCDGRPYVELELVEGGSLAARLEGTPWPPRAAVRLVESVARAVSAAHLLGIVHRDLKPANILMTDEGEPKVSDFGLAKRLEESSGLTQTESILGSPSYMAPEQAEGRAKDVGPAADIYALGANLYELLTGRPPFVAPSLLATLALVRNAEPVSPKRLQPGLTRDLETICLKCLQKEPSKRYESAAALAADLTSYLDHEPIRARPISQWERALKWIRRRPSTAALILVSTVAIVASFGGWMLHRAELSRQHEASRLRVATLRSQADSFVLLGREALRRQDWEGARTQLSSALALIRSDAHLVETKAAVGKLLALSGERIAEAKSQAAAHARFVAFLRLYDDAVFYQSEYTGLDPEANLRASRAAASRALAQYGLSTGDGSNTGIDPPRFDKSEVETITANSYELTLILAELISKPLKGEDATEQAREALRILDGAQRLRAPTSAFHLRRAAYIERIGDPDAAEDERRKAEDVPESGNSAVDDFLAGEQAYRNHDFKRAVSAFQRTLLLKPDHFWAQYLLAICHLKTHRAAEAQASLTACQSQRPSFVWTYLLKGFAEGEMSEFDLAEADFQRAIELGLNDEERYVMLVNRGVMRIHQGRNQTAIEDLKTAIALKPDQFQAYINLAQAYETLQRSNEALETLNEAIARAPGQAVLHRARSQVQRRRSKNDEALADLDRAIALSRPDDPMLASDHLERGLILQEAGRSEEALAACDQAMALRPDQPNIHRLRGVVLVGLKRYEEAIKSFDVCIAQGTPSPALYEARGLALAWRGSYARAISDYTMALGSGQGTSALYENRGWAYLSSGASELALRDFDRALRLDSSNGHALGGRALSYVQLRKHEEAAADARASARSNPEDSRQLYNAARVICQAAACLEANPSQVNRARATAGQYRAEALELLARSVGLVPDADRARFWSQVVRTDGALDPIRRARKYLELDARVATPANSRSIPGGSQR
jgi:eukaryotic-like serine/threonine-protein kinase